MSPASDSPTAPDQDSVLRATVTLAREYTEARLTMERIEGNIETLLGPAVHHWARKEPVPCGHSGGWGMDTEGEGLITHDGKIRLIHECFSAHQYNSDDTYRTEASPADLLANIA
jgi:hypothetical protein